MTQNVKGTEHKSTELTDQELDDVQGGASKGESSKESKIMETVTLAKLKDAKDGPKADSDGKFMETVSL